MKNIVYFFSIIWLLAINHGITHAQTTENALSATSTNGKVSIMVKNATSFNQFFVVESNDSVQVIFYFGEDNIRNGAHKAKREILTSGSARLVFTTLDILSSDDLTFYATETFDGGIVKSHVFWDGIYKGAAADMLNDCPINISCSSTGAKTLSLQFDINVVGPIPIALFQFTLFAPGGSINGTLTATGINILANSYVVRGASMAPGDCDKIMNGVVTVFINGKRCVFSNGALVTTPNNLTFSNYYSSSNTTCSSLFEDCGLSLIKILEGPTVKNYCHDWVFNLGLGNCSTTIPIQSLKPVSIGTGGEECASDVHFMSGFNLTVKNGTATDRLKLCKTQWCDHVFSDNYKLMPLEQLAIFLKEKRHLPNMPSGAAIEAEGSFDLGDIMYRQQENIEEIFLHILAEEQEISNIEILTTILELREKLSIH
jgi:hypothetical protein